MLWQEFWTLIHILLFVYWLGADLGVFLLAKKAADTSLDMGQRMLCLRMSLMIDLTPRMAFTLMFPVGMMMSEVYGLAWPLWLKALVWLLAGLWLGLTVATAASEGKPINTLLQTIGKVWLWTLTVFFFGLGGYSLIADSIFLADWLAIKVTLFGFICLLAIGIDWAFGPGIPAFLKMMQDGPDPDSEAVFQRSTNKTLIVVGTLYAVLLVMAFLGTIGKRMPTLNL